MQSRSVRRSNDHPFREQNQIHRFGREFLGPRKYPQGGRSESSRCLGEKTFRHAITHQHSSVAILGESRLQAKVSSGMLVGKKISGIGVLTIIGHRQDDDIRSVLDPDHERGRRCIART